MKKIKFFTTLLCLCACLTSCSRPTPDHGDNQTPRVELEYAQHGKLIELEPIEVYEKAITNGDTFVVYYAVDLCKACEKLSGEMKSFAKNRNTNIYWVDMTAISEENYNYLYKASTMDGQQVGAYPLPAYSENMEIAFPLMHIYTRQIIMIAINEQFTDKLLKYTKVSNPEDNKNATSAS